MFEFLRERGLPNPPTALKDCNFPKCRGTKEGTTLNKAAASTGQYPILVHEVNEEHSRIDESEKTRFICVTLTDYKMAVELGYHEHHISPT